MARCTQDMQQDRTQAYPTQHGSMLTTLPACLAHTKHALHRHHSTTPPTHPPPCPTCSLVLLRQHLALVRQERRQLALKRLELLHSVSAGSAPAADGC
jgi:hypothetical protein